MENQNHYLQKNLELFFKEEMFTWLKRSVAKLRNYYSHADKEYEQISADYEVDLILYANNYEKGEAIVDIETVEEAINVFRNAKRAAKRTTDEKGIVETYFANMFGPAQHKDICDPLIKEYLDKIYSHGIRVAQIRTQLGIPGMAMEGPRIAGKYLFKQLIELEKSGK